MHGTSRGLLSRLHVSNSAHYINTQPLPLPYIYRGKGVSKCTPPYLLICSRVIENVVNSRHLNKNSAVAEGVSNSREPGSQVAECSDSVPVSGRHHEDDDIDVKNNGSDTYEVVYVGAGQLDQPEKRGNTCVHGDCLLLGICL